MPGLFSINLQDQIQCVKREIGMRESVYPRWVQNGKMKQFKADEEIATMKEVLKTLQGLAPGKTGTGADVVG